MERTATGICPLCDQSHETAGDEGIKAGARIEIFQKLNHRALPVPEGVSGEFELPRSIGACADVEPEAKRVLAETLHGMLGALEIDAAAFTQRWHLEPWGARVYTTGVVVPSREFIDLLVRLYEEKHGPLSERARTHLLAMYVAALEAGTGAPRA
ncbi:hypothetical protein [Streptomyces sp. WAC 01529]|uniref:hypothetical protein n=1 Tax=Streptomyces sp. WAC 01529 TaxID=2203205 RepID=UPI000F741038|nr:hypothetical protein [Streptomyces sp. WAC 01529]